MKQRNEIVQFLKQFREEVIRTFETLEPTKRFERTFWEHATGGGGEISLLRGDVFEKAAVNWSGVLGSHFPRTEDREDATGPFFATGVSIITHMHNPHMPTVHMNIRYVETPRQSWFGGGYDLTPMGFAYDEDTAHFHDTAKKALGPTIYTQLSEAAKKYFYIPHQKKERGVGGLFFDHDPHIETWKIVAHSFLPAIMPIYRKRIATPFTESDKELQLKLRGHYAEFNLLYDRGTQFGFLSGGNPGAILCSMPPLVKW